MFKEMHDQNLIDISKPETDDQLNFIFVRCQKYPARQIVALGSKIYELVGEISFKATSSKSVPIHGNLLVSVIDDLEMTTSSDYGLSLDQVLNYSGDTEALVLDQDATDQISTRLSDYEHVIVHVFVKDEDYRGPGAKQDLQ